MCEGYGQEARLCYQGGDEPDVEFWVDGAEECVFLTVAVPVGVAVTVGVRMVRVIWEDLLS